MAKATYKDSGVDLEAYAESMAKLPRLLRRTHNPRVLSAEGGFAGLFSLDFPGRLFRRDYEDPVLVSCTDGVGTKVCVAQMADRHETVGIDLVAMCVNDALCLGAEPLFFLDYVAMSHDDPTRLEALVEGISKGCLAGELALVGGETAIMPDLYERGHYDLAGFCVGVAERDNLLDGRQITAGDQLIGIASTGLHSNGYSLARKIVFDIAGLGINDTVQECGGTVADVLLEPTRIYVKPIRNLLSIFAEQNPIHGIAHITGGGLVENVTRILPGGRAIEIDQASWPTPEVFNWLQRLGDVDDAEMARVFNMGIGLVLVVRADAVPAVCDQLVNQGLECWTIGQVR